MTRGCGSRKRPKWPLSAPTLGALAAGGKPSDSRGVQRYIYLVSPLAPLLGIPTPFLTAHQRPPPPTYVCAGGASGATCPVSTAPQGISLSPGWGHLGAVGALIGTDKAKHPRGPGTAARESQDETRIRQGCLLSRLAALIHPTPRHPLLQIRRLPGLQAPSLRPPPDRPPVPSECGAQLLF